MALMDDYSLIVGESIVEELRLIASHLWGKRIINVNSTAVGGGVAEILNRMVPRAVRLAVQRRLAGKFLQRPVCAFQRFAFPALELAVVFKCVAARTNFMPAAQDRFNLSWVIFGIERRHEKGGLQAMRPKQVEQPPHTGAHAIAPVGEAPVKIFPLNFVQIDRFGVEIDGDEHRAAPALRPRITQSRHDWQYTNWQARRG